MKFCFLLFALVCACSLPMAAFSNEVDSHARYISFHKKSAVINSEDSKTFDGKGGNDTLQMRINTNRTNYLIGGTGRDVFIFTPISPASHNIGYSIQIIKDFSPREDTINVSGFFTDFAELMENAYEHDGETIIFLDDMNIIRLPVMHLTSLKDQFFIFGRNSTLSKSEEKHLRQLDIEESCVANDKGQQWCSKGSIDAPALEHLSKR